jgi:hypothetical protein
VNTKKENKEYEVDDITKNVDKKKKIKSGKKGNRGENSLAKTLSARFNQPFSRAYERSQLPAPRPTC